MSWQPGSGGGGGTGTGGGGGDGGGGSSGTSWGSIFNVPDSLKKFAAQPTAFILGVVLQSVLGGVETMVTAILDAIRYVFVGEHASSTEGGLGLADIPLVVAGWLTDAGDTIGSPILDTVETFITGMTDTALAFGPLSPIALAGEIALVLVVSYYVSTTLFRVVLDLIPGAGGLLK